MDDYADLFINLSKPTENKYSLVLSFSRPDNQAEIHPVQCECNLRVDEIRRKNLPREIGDLLREDLFSDPAAKNFFNQCLTAAQSASLKPRLRLLIDRSARELHNLRWETLLHPEKDEFLSLDQNILFSRFLFSSDWGRVELRPKGKLRALVVVASPNDLMAWDGLPDGQSLAAVDVAGEVERAKTGLAGIDTIEVLESRGDDPGRVTLPRLVQKLQEGYDILYLVCHGVLDRVKRQDLASPRRPFIWLEKNDGSSERVDGEHLVLRIEQLDPAQRPRLIVLASCQSAETQVSDDRGALAALGPRLAEVGVPAVVAMQANVSMKTVEIFMPGFFQKLLETGRVDQAMAAGRALIQDRSDWWAPVLFLRLRGGQLWYQTSISGASSDFDFWQGVIASIRDKRCTPVLGSGILDFLSGSLQEIAHDWAILHRYPLLPHSQDEFPQVSQYLASYVRVIPANYLVRYLIDRLRVRYGAILSQDTLDANLEELEVIEQARLLDKMLSTIGEHRRLNDPDDPFRVLAGLPIKMYITTNPDHLLENALQATGRKEPQSLYFCWKNRLNTPENIDRLSRLVEPSVRRPLVYHLFGSLEEPESLVLTEDDYFDYLMWINKTNPQIPIPSQVLNAWTDNALLFLGFKTSEWHFRMLFRSILNEERRQTRSKGYDSLVVQVQPGDDHIQPDRARKYLEKYFLNEKFNVYWGSPNDFIKELRSQWNGGDNP